jgi:protein-tyrosine phosphatase
MIDLHSHFLYGIDDGPQDLPMTLAMLRQAASVGIWYLLATPHVNERISAADETRIFKTFENIRQKIKKENINLEIGLAGEVDYNADMLSWLDHSWLLFGKEKKYLLFEIPLFNLPVHFTELLFQLTVRGVIPVLAHPERNIHIQKKPKILLEWINHGCLIQLNAGSVLGKFGAKCRRLCDRMLEANMVTLVGSDAHNTDSRGYHVMQEAFEWINGRFSPEYADILFKSNPGSMITGAELLRFEVEEKGLNLSISRKIFRKLLLDGKK